jgi:penicillin-binding protein-related factor A (putative recombinase)
LLNFLEHEKRKSIPFTWMDQHCGKVKANTGIVLDYLPLVLMRREG